VVDHCGDYLFPEPLEHHLRKSAVKNTRLHLTTQTLPNRNQAAAATPRTWATWPRKLH